MRYRAVIMFTVVVLLAVATSAASNEKVLYTFTGGSDGANPNAGLIFDQAGDLYGTAYMGGASGCGAVFELIPSQGGGWTYKGLYSFTCGDDGFFPAGGLVFDQSGNLYGTTQFGGEFNDYGTVFELSPNKDGTWTKTTLYLFTAGDDGVYPSASLILDAAGNLYGTTSSCFCSGGGGKYGTVFELVHSQSGWTAKGLHTFTGGSDGAIPYSSLIFDRAGNLYGTTVNGGGNGCYGHGCGVVFKLTPKSGEWIYSVLYTFTGKQDGGNPWAGLISDGSGILYSTTSVGGTSNSGTVFKLAPGPRPSPTVYGGWVETVLYAFTGSSDGGDPRGGLIFDSAGNLNGTTAGGGGIGCGLAGCGTVFRLTPQSNGSWTETVLYSFTGPDGAGPQDSLVLDQAGNLYGTTVYGGQTGCQANLGCGVVFEVTP
jgi:uncharacterized repeat protein (TIGR03803 family)